MHSDYIQKIWLGLDFIQIPSGVDLLENFPQA